MPRNKSYDQMTIYDLENFENEQNNRFAEMCDRTITKDSQIIKHIEWSELDNYINRPVYEPAKNKWYILSGYRNSKGIKTVAFVGCNVAYEFDKIKLYEREV